MLLEGGAVGDDAGRELAATTALRQLQYAEGERRDLGKRSRRELAPDDTRRYTAEILDGVDLRELVAALPHEGPPRCCASSATRRPATAR